MRLVVVEKKKLTALFPWFQSLLVKVSLYSVLAAIQRGRCCVFDLVVTHNIQAMTQIGKIPNFWFIGVIHFDVMVHHNSLFYLVTTKTNQWDQHDSNPAKNVTTARGTSDLPSAVFLIMKRVALSSIMKWLMASTWKGMGVSIP